MSSDIALPRTCSYLLTVFPWMSDFLVHDAPLAKLLNNDDGMREVGSKLDTFMTKLQLATDQESMEFKDRLYSQPGDSYPYISRNMGVKMCLLLAAFRAFNMAVYHSDSREQGELIIHPKKKVVHEIQIWPKMSDWHNILRNCRSTLSSIDDIASSTAPTSGNTIAALLKTIATAEYAAKATLIVKNFTYASLYLAILMKDPDPNILLNVPDDPRSFLELASRLADSTTNDIEYGPGSDFADDNDTRSVAVGEAKSVQAKRYMRAPFLLAAMACPMILLLPLSLLSKTSSKPDLIQTAECIGNDYGPVLKKVNSNLWRALFKASKGEENPVQALKNFVSQIDWDEINADDQEGWYHTELADPEIHTSLTFDPVSLTEKVTDPSDDMSQDLYSSNHPADITDTAAIATSSKDDDGVLTEIHKDPSPTIIKPLNILIVNPGDGIFAEERLKKRKASSKSKRTARIEQASSIVQRFVTVAPADGNEIQRIKISPPPEATLLHRLDAIVRPFNMSDICRGQDDITLGANAETPVSVKPTLRCYNARGVPIDISPRHHMESELDTLRNIYVGYLTSCNNGIPPFVFDEAQSLFSVTTKERFDATSTSTLVNTIKHKCIIVSGDDVVSNVFDECGLSNTAELNVVVSVQDQSIPPIDGDYGCRVKKGTLLQVLEAARDPEGSVLNVLDLPQTLGARQTPFSMEMVAWSRTEGLPHCKSDQHLPVRDLRWALVATRGALHPWYIDSDGFGTFITCNTGRKLIFIAKDRQDIEIQAWDSIHRFIGPLFDPYESCSSIWNFEGIVLEAGDTIYFPRNTPHFVYTDEHSICFGGHFYPPSTMQETLVSFVHMRMSGGISTNTYHLVSHDLFHRIIAFYHDTLGCGNHGPLQASSSYYVPLIEDLDSLLNIFSLCALVILTNALSEETYETTGEPNNSEINVFLQQSYDLNSMSTFQRKKCSYMLGLAWELVNWISTNYITTTDSLPQIDIYTNVFVPFMANACLAIWNYHVLDRAERGNGMLSCTTELLWDQIEACFIEHPAVLRSMEGHPEVDRIIVTLAFDGDLSINYIRDNPFQGHSVRGNTSKDNLFDLGLSCGWAIYENMDYEAHDHNNRIDEQSDQESPPKKKNRQR